MKALVTGGSGFIGSHVVDRLIAKGIGVRVFDMVLPRYGQNIEFYKGSLLDLESVRLALNGIDVVFHLAAIADVNDVVKDPFYAEAINVRGTANLLEAIRRSSGIRRLVYGSTTWVYSAAKETNVDEDTALVAPDHFYTATKITSEYYCHSYGKLFNIPTTILRYGIPYGPRAREAAVIPVFVKKAFNKEPLTIAGDGMQFRKFVYVEDLAEGNVLALQAAGKNRVYNLDGQEKVTIKQIAETIQKVVGDVKIEYTPARAGDFGGKEVNSDRAAAELGWKPKVAFEEGVRRYVAWLKEDMDRRKKEWDRVDPALR
jgi:UDP-glucose 4-epimerase